MKQGFWFLCAIIVVALSGGSLASVSAQTSSPTPDPFTVQLTSTPNTSFNSLTSDISANGRFVVFTSNGNVATQNKRNADGNREIFLADYAQRRIFQITDTRNVPIPPPSPSPSPSPTASPSPTPTPIPTPADRTQVKIEIDNRNPVISLQPVLSGGVRNYIIVFSSNAPDPKFFDGSDSTTLDADANSEIWIYRVPAVADVDLTLGTDLPLIPLDQGTFDPAITNTSASRAPTAGSSTAAPFFADDNREATISDDGKIIAFISTRTQPGTAGNADGNPELYLYTIDSKIFRQVTNTQDPTPGVGFIFQTNPSLSADGSVVAFMSTANLASSNADNNGEVFVATVGAGITFTQVTRTTNNITPANILSPGRRLSRDGKLIAFESRATDPKSGGAPTTQVLGNFVYTIASDTFNEVGTRSPVNDFFNRFPTFTDYNSSLAPSGLVFSSALNFRPDGTFPSSSAQANEGLNPDNSSEIYLTQVPVASSNTFVRLSNIPALSSGSRPIASETHKRIAFSIGGLEFAGANSDFSIEVFYLLSPTVTAQSSGVLSFFTGASLMPVAAATPLPSPTPTPTPTPSPVPGSPIGLAPGELSIVRSTVALAPSDAETLGDVSEETRSPALPIELNGVSLSVNGAAAGLYSAGASSKQINFVLPIGVAPGVGAVAINVFDAGANTDTIHRGLLQIVSGQPDIFTVPTGPGGRAAATNVTNPMMPSGEPFNVTSTDSTGATVATIIELNVTGVRGAAASEITVTVGTTAISGAAIVSVRPNTKMPGWDLINFTLPASLAGAGDVPVQVQFVRGGLTTVSRPADTAPHITIN